LDKNVLDKYSSEYDKFQDKIKEKYNPSEEEELIGIFNNIIKSIDNEYDNDYYSLPTYQEGKSWQELFPSRLNTFFGKNEETDGEDDFSLPESTISEEN